MFRNQPTIGLTFVGIALGTTTLVSLPANALSLFGEVNVTGASTFNVSEIAPTTDTVEFINGTVSTSSTGAFTSLIGSSVNISSIALTNPSGSSGMMTYDGIADNPLVTFNPGTSDEFSFEATNPITLQRVSTGDFGVILTINAFSGNFISSSGSVIGSGIFSTNQFGPSGSYSMTIQAIPEPLTILGVGTALGFGGFFKRQISKKQKSQNRA